MTEQLLQSVSVIIILYCRWKHCQLMLAVKPCPQLLPWSQAVERPHSTLVSLMLVPTIMYSELVLVETVFVPKRGTKQSVATCCGAQFRHWSRH